MTSQLVMQPVASAPPALRSYLEDFERFAEQETNGEPSWMAQLRRAAISSFASLGFPTPRDEDWHFTSVAPIARRWS